MSQQSTSGVGEATGDGGEASYSPTPHHHHLSGGPWVNESECHCEGTAQKQTRKGISEVIVSLNLSVWASDEHILFVDIFYELFCYELFFSGS